MKIYYKSYLKELSRQLRKNSTLSETLLWNSLKHRQLYGYDFHRQKQIDNYIVDFYCPKLKLAIEIDGESHVLKEDYDKNRQDTLEQLGIRFLRFDDILVLRNIEGVLLEIRQWVQENSCKL